MSLGRVECLVIPAPMSERPGWRDAQDERMSSFESGILDKKRPSTKAAPALLPIHAIQQLAR